MRKLFFRLFLLVLLVLVTAAPSMAATTSPLYVDWGEGSSTYAAGIGSFGLMVGLASGYDRLPLYLDAGFDYGDGISLANLGIALRARRSFLVFKPYVGVGLVYNLDDWYPAWRSAPYILGGVDFLWFYSENAVVFTPDGVENTVRAGLRVAF